MFFLCSLKKRKLYIVWESQFLLVVGKKLGNTFRQWLCCNEAAKAECQCFSHKQDEFIRYYSVFTCRNSNHFTIYHLKALTFGFVVMKQQRQNVSSFYTSKMSSLGITMCSVVGISSIFYNTSFESPNSCFVQIKLQRQNISIFFT